MNFKIFAIIFGALISVVAILGGTYFYLFEYSKPKNYTSNTHDYFEQKSYTHNDNIANKIHNNSSYDLNTSKEIIPPKQDQNPINDTMANNQIQENLHKDHNTSNQNQENPDTTKANLINNQTEKEIHKNPKTLEKKQTQNKQVKQNKKLSAAQEYLTIGKNSRLEPKLSTKNMKVYILDGKFLSQYRINLLKNMLSTIQDRSKDYYLSVFVKMLPKGEMKLNIYNKDIIFSNMKKAYKYINLEQLRAYLDNPEELNRHVAREEILKRLRLQIKKDGIGSEFSKHIKSLKTGLDTAQYFFPFCEIIEITSV
ncbi:hypothetical protein LNU06_02970 [Campylobacter sp. VicNov18]|uniref:hypothetical protein n=1 Tax=Campylobacter bilis TaxID=2691918 RepID=UPI00130DC2E4|nr:hypothetical protein [Campylobacter bilis]MPV63607.1 hypothetical protein [Campylobacter hepaticus]MBM0637107.1 hypothetical protein [Campylobacter bilis]MCC8277734.1 hypothetical protein [Campylobacter bilis]MCC8299343.1 hypothetical protein [Campylobacter bilis]MCC8300643.1 hypothetical protein [Campylobacter bilis]